jgi:hypothetical protein
MKSAFFWDIKQRKVVIPYRHIVKGQEFQEFSLKVTCIFLIRMDIFMIIITVFNNIFPSVLVVYSLITYHYTL